MVEALIAVAVLGLVLIGWVITTGNRYARLENLIRESWANVDVALKRRHDLIPNLVETVRAHAAHERDLLERVVRARQNALGGDSAAESTLARSVNQLLARAEAYPELRASASFLELQRELVSTEDRIAAARRFYNANIRDYNILLESFPASLLARGRTPRDFYEIDPIEVSALPRVDLQSDERSLRTP